MPRLARPPLPSAASLSAISRMMRARTMPSLQGSCLHRACSHHLYQGLIRLAYRVLGRTPSLACGGDVALLSCCYERIEVARDSGGREHAAAKDPRN
jgi:hypothetical protein